MLVHNDKGKFIVIEGMDGTGKTTLTLNLFKLLNLNGVKTHSTCEPTKDTYGMAARKIMAEADELPSSRDKQLEYRESVYQLLCMADRVSHSFVDGFLKYSINNYLDCKYTVISDRYFPSGLVYPCYEMLSKPDGFYDGLMRDNAFFYKVEYLYEVSANMGLLKPDVIIILETDPEEAYNRIMERGEDKFYYESLDKLKYIQEGYRLIGDFLNDNNFVNFNIDTTKNEHEVLVDVVDCLNKIKLFDKDLVIDSII